MMICRTVTCDLDLRPELGGMGPGFSSPVRMATRIIIYSYGFSAS